MLADDEGIVTDSLKMIIEKNFGTKCETESAKTGRSVIELAETFRPDIAFMDIQMPGINGIEAMKEIRKNNPNLIFIVMSAYDKFDYAKEALNLGAIDYLNKPFSRDMIIGVLERAMKLVDTDREKRATNLMIKEKMETVVPVIESGFIYSVVFQENWQEGAENYKALLSQEKEYGFMLVLESGETKEGGKLTNTVGTGIRLQNHYSKIREIIKEALDCYVGPLMANSIVCYVPVAKAETDYNERVEIIDKTHGIIEKLRDVCNAEFRIGIGASRPLREASESYHDALDSLKLSVQSVAHVNDLPVGCKYDDDYPIDIEKNLFEAVEEGNINTTRVESERFFKWMEGKAQEDMVNIRLKILEFVLFAEQKAYLSGGMTYHFSDRKDYLPAIMNTDNLQELSKWFTDHMCEAARKVSTCKNEKSDDLITSVKNKINERYMTFDISLDSLSREVDVSSYYLSRLFREETGETFMEYLTNLRINKAKELINNTDKTMKDICFEVGYNDPNYFSRMFKKNVGITPTEYRERG